MKLVDNWHDITKRAHSMWAFYLGAFVLWMPDVLYYFFEIDTSPRAWIIISSVLIVYGILGRLLDQGVSKNKIRSPWWISGVVAALVSAVSLDVRPGMFSEPPPDRNILSQSMPVSENEFLAKGLAFVGSWEGLRLVAYQDIVGVWTVCYGETEGVRPGDTYTKEECEAMFAPRLLSFRNAVLDAMNDKVKGNLLPVDRDVAFTSLAYNIGKAGARKSTAMKRLNQFDVRGACEAMTWWNKAGGRVIRGLVRRRDAEFKLCLMGTT